MKLTKHLLAVASGALLVSSVACHSDKPVTAKVPPKAQAPAIATNSVPPASASDKLSQAPAATTPAPSDPADELITTVEKEFQLAEDSVKAGNMLAARQSYHHAFDLMVATPLDIHGDPRLQKEFDRVLAGVNSFEQQQSQKQAVAQQDNPPAQLSEPAPIDEANEITPPVDPNVKAKAAEEVKVTHSDLPLMMTDQVAGYIDYFSGRGRGVLERALARSGRYDEMIRRTLKEEGLPQDLIYLAQAESGFHPTALSRAGARGIWQFMASRGKGYGLDRNLWVDERQDPEKATKAAAEHLRDLYHQFGDWYLAMAAYNSGPGTVQQAVKRTGYADFWELYKRDVLPKETRNYVPIILAVTIMAKNPEQYGLESVVREQPVPYDSVKVDYAVDLRLVAECVGSTPDALQDLNPSLLRWTTPKGSEFDLHLPKDTKKEYLDAIAGIPPDMRAWWRYHKVINGDTLASLARAYRTTPQAIAHTNNLEADAELAADTQLIIPVTPGKHAAAEDAVSYSRAITRYKVRKGDTAQTVADNFGVPAVMVRRWNHLKGDSVRGHTILYVHLPVAPSIHSTRQLASAQSKIKPKSSKGLEETKHSAVVRHKVIPGETLSSIASTHHTTVQALKRDNENVANLRPGMVLIIR